MYRDGGVRGREPAEISGRVLDMLNVTMDVAPGKFGDRILRHGPVIVVCNYDSGALAVPVLAKMIGSHRGDVRILADASRSVLPGLEGLAIPMARLPGTAYNTQSRDPCEDHLRRGGVLGVFADREGAIVASRLALSQGATVVPVHMDGFKANWLEAVCGLGLGEREFVGPWELALQAGCRLRIRVGYPVEGKWLSHMDSRRLAPFLRMLIGEQPFLRRGLVRPPSAHSASRPSEPVALPIRGSRMAREVAGLPRRQLLLERRRFSVFVAEAGQIPSVLEQISQERERVFRLKGAGSGTARDWDEHDQRYHHLFLWDRVGLTIVGGCRVGRSDDLIARFGMRGVYLSQAFEFAPGFHRSAAPALELDRSFVVPECEGSVHARYLLWLGVGRLLCRWQKYQRIYGTVPLWRLYDDRLIRMLCDLVVVPTEEVGARDPLLFGLGAHWSAFRREFRFLDARDLSALCRSMDPRSEELARLMGQYLNVGARFIAVGSDANVAETPMLLFEIEVAGASGAVIEKFLGPGAGEYLEHHRKLARDPCGSRAPVRLDG